MTDEIRQTEIIDWNGIRIEVRYCPSWSDAYEEIYGHALRCLMPPVAYSAVMAIEALAGWFRMSLRALLPCHVPVSLRSCPGLLSLTANVTGRGRHATGCPIHSRALALRASAGPVLPVPPQ